MFHFDLKNMWKQTTCIAFFLLPILLHAQSIGIGTTSPNNSAILDISSTNKGFLMPRMTTAQRDAIVSPAEGLQIFNADDRCVDIYLSSTSSWTKDCTVKSTGNYTLQSNTWRPRADFGGSARSEAVGFSIGTKGYMGTGNTGYGIGSNEVRDFWEYDQANNIWSQKADFGGSVRYGAVGFSIGTKGYIGTGYYGAYLRDFWEYDPSNNLWTQKADFGGVGRKGAVGFSIGTKGYIGTGYDANFKRDFWEFDPNINVWTQKSDFGGTARYYAVGLSINTKGYIGTGYDGGFRKDFWEFNPGAVGSLGTWTQKPDFGGVPRSNAVGFSMLSRGYIGTGYDGVTERKDFWEYDPFNNSWTQKTDFGGISRSGAVGFSIGDKGFISSGYTNFINKNDVWEYNTLPTLGKEYTESMPNEATKYRGVAWSAEGSTIYPSLDDALVSFNFKNPIQFGKGITKENHAGKIGYQTFSSNSLDIVGAGLTYPNRNVRIYDRLYFENILANRKIILWESANNDHQFFGFGVESGTLRYQSSGIHRFYSGTSASTSNLLMTIFDNGSTVITGPMCATAYNTCSDVTLKKNILPLTASLTNLLALQGYTYQWKDEKQDSAIQSGFLAQEVEKLFPHLVKKDEKGLLSVNYTGLIPYMVETMKVLKAENQALKMSENEYKLKLEKLEGRFEKLEALMLHESGQ